MKLKVEEAGLTPLHGCRGCGEDFRSLALFDAHHVGDHALDWPEHENGRRCLDSEEMSEKDWAKDDKGRWFDPAAVERARKAFADTSPDPSEPFAVPAGASASPRDGSGPL